jgi:hypothetical protein
MSRHQDTPQFYMPYDSDNDTGTDTGTDTDEEDYDSDDLPTSEDARIRREEDPRYALIRTAGPNFNTSEQQLKYMEHAPGATYNVDTNITTLQNLVYLNPPKTTITSLFSVKAANRDRRVYPSPFNYEIKLPRVYKNVTKFQLVQLSFPNNTVDLVVTSQLFLSTFVTVLISQGVPPCCISSCVQAIECGSPAGSIGLLEEGRTNSAGQPAIVSLNIPDGVYTVPRMIDQLNVEANNTPPFNIISYNDFKEYYQTTGDISILFNEPGEYFKSRLTGGKVYKNPSKVNIINTYYPKVYVDSLVDITDKIAFNAYYYPILKEMLSSNRAESFLTLDSYNYNQVYDFIVNHFESLDNTDYYIIASTNQSVLDAYRRVHTFELRNINKYNWSIDTLTNNLHIQHNSLHPSFKKDVQNNFNQVFEAQLTNAGLTRKSLETLKTHKSVNNTILKSLEKHLSTVMSQYYLASNYSYTGGDNHNTTQRVFSYTDLDAEEDFTTMFNFTSQFGNQFANFPGVLLTFRNFLDFHSTVSSYYNTVASDTSTVSSIYGMTYQTHKNYVSKKYNNILPTSYIENQSYFADMPLGVQMVGTKAVNIPGFSVTAGSCPEDCSTVCCEAVKKLIYGWYSCLPVQNVTNSLSYRLGIENFNFNQFNLISTIASLPAGRENYFLQINNDQSFNNMDIAMNENYNISNETTGQVKLMYAKILTGGLGAGEVAQTVIQNPVVFENPLGKLDRLQFKIYYDDESLTPAWLVVPFEVGFNDWDATFQIDEEVGFADRNAGFSGQIPTIPIPTNPSALQYMALTSTNNSLNK